MNFFYNSNNDNTYEENINKKINIPKSIFNQDINLNIINKKETILEQNLNKEELNNIDIIISIILLLKKIYKK